MVQNKKKSKKSGSDSKKSTVSLSDVDKKLHKKPKLQKSVVDQKPIHPKNDKDEDSIDIDIDIKVHIKKFKVLRNIILASTLLLLVAIAGIVLVGNQEGNSDSGDDAFKEALDVSEGSEELLESRLGFSASYNPDVIQASASVIQDDTVVSAGEDTLTDWSDFTEATFTHQENAPTEVLTDRNDLAQLTIATSQSESFFSEQRTTPQETAKSDLELTQEFFAPTVLDGETLTEIDTATATIGTTEYQKTSYEVTSKYGLTASNIDQYATVQNDAPFVMTLTYSKAVSPGKLQDLAKIASSVEYSPPVRESFGSVELVAPRLIGGITSPFLVQASQSLPSEAVNTGGGALQGSTLLSVIARNAVATVRVAHIECRDVTLLLPGGNTGMVLTDICNGGIGSGSLVTDDGYISTNGHVATFGDATILQGFISFASLEDLRQYTAYLERIDVLAPGAGDLLISDVLSGSSVAERILFSSPQFIPSEYIRNDSSDRKYAIQLSDEPIEANLESLPLEFIYTDSVIPAELVSFDFDPNSDIQQVDLQGQNNSDVALLKADLSNTPTVELGSIDGLSEGDLITALGFPAFVDGGLGTEEDRTVASATQGEVIEITFDNRNSNDRKLVNTDVPIASGNSGGPTFNRDGQMIGLATYGSAGRCADGQCFGDDGIIRDVADFISLLDDEGIAVDVSQDEATQLWISAVDNFSIGYFKTAVKDIEKFEELYDSSYLSDLFTSVAETRIANGESLEPALPFKAIGIGAAVVLPLIMVLTGAVLFMHRKKGANLGVAYPINPLSANVQYVQPVYQQPQPMPQNVQFNPYPTDMGQSVVAPMTEAEKQQLAQQQAAQAQQNQTQQPPQQQPPQPPAQPPVA